MISDSFVIISAPSGTGKNTILNKLLERRTDLKYSISTTTRKPREEECNGKEYYFCETSKFEEKIQNDCFLEYAFVFDNYYGTTKQEIIRIQQEKCTPILDIDIQGFLLLQKKIPDVLSIFIMPPSLEELENRLFSRGTESKEEIKKRLGIAKKEIEYKDVYRHIIINDDLSVAIDELDALIKIVDTQR